MNEGMIRLVSTSQCMYNCFFCHKEGINDIRQNYINKDDISFLYKVYNQFFNKDEIRISRWWAFIKKRYNWYSKRIT